MTIVYAATCTPDRVHSKTEKFEWRSTEAEANDAAEKFRAEAAIGDAIAVVPVQVPDNVYARGVRAVTSYLYARSLY